MTEEVHSLDINVPKKAAYNTTIGTTIVKPLFSSPQNRHGSAHRLSSQKSHNSSSISKKSKDSSFRGDRSIGGIDSSLRGIDSSLRGSKDRQASNSVLLVSTESIIPTVAPVAVDPPVVGDTKPPPRDDINETKPQDINEMAAQSDTINNADRVQETLGTLPILIVDDSVSILKMTKRAIQNECANISFMEAKNGEEAFEQVVAAFMGFELIITDIQMPICNGFDFTRKVRQLEREKGLTPKLIIGISANDQPKISIEAKESGMT